MSFMKNPDPCTARWQAIYEKSRPMYRKMAGGQAATQTEKGKVVF